MGRIIGWVVGFVLMFAFFSMEGAVDDWWLHRARASAETPDRGEYTIPTFKPSEQVDQYADQQDDGMWHYRWELTTSAPAKDVVAFYRERWPDALQRTEEETYFEFVPARATPDEKSRIDIFEGDEGKTSIVITQLAKQRGWLPPHDVRKWGFRLVFVGIISGLWFLLRGPLAQILARGMMEKVALQGGTQFKTLTLPPGDVGVSAYWDGNTRILEGMGFKKVCDFTSPTVTLENYARILQRDRTTFAVLYWARVNGQPYTYADFGTWFLDGSSVTTSASRYTGDFKRPDDRPLVQVPEGTPLADEFRKHEEAVAAHAKPGREPVPVNPESIFDIWHEEERAMLEFRRKGGFLAKEGVQRILAEVDAKTAAAGQAPTPASGSAPSGPPRPAAASSLAPAAGPPRPNVPGFGPPGPPPGRPAVPGFSGSPARAEDPFHKPPPAPTPAPPAGDQRVEFRAEILDRIREAHPELTITDRATPLEIYVQHDAFRKMVDLESLYFLVQKPNIDREKAILSFLSQIKNLEA